jgi:hypothetical protein
VVDLSRVTHALLLGIIARLRVGKGTGAFHIIHSFPVKNKTLFPLEVTPNLIPNESNGLGLACWSSREAVMEWLAGRSFLQDEEKKDLGMTP